MKCNEVWRGRGHGRVEVEVLEQWRILVPPVAVVVRFGFSR